MYRSYSAFQALFYTTGTFGPHIHLFKVHAGILGGNTGYGENASIAGNRDSRYSQSDVEVQDT